MKRIWIIFAFITLTSVIVSAQEPVQMNDTVSCKTIHLREPFTMLDNNQFAFYYANEKHLFINNSFVMARLYDIQQVKVNPTGASVACLDNSYGRSVINIYETSGKGILMATIRDRKHPSAVMCYSANARTLYVGTEDGMLQAYETNDYKLTSSYTLSFPPEKLYASQNGYYLAAVRDNMVEIWNLHDNKSLKILEMPATVFSLDFYSANNQMAVTTANGRCTVYDTRTFEVANTFKAMGLATSCTYHPDGKYLAVVTGDKRIALLNLYNGAERKYVDAEIPTVNLVRFSKSSYNGKMYIMYDGESSLTMKEIEDLSPNRSKALKEMLDARMDEWSKKLENETLEEYNERVNEDTRMEQLRLFEAEIVTAMAGNLADTLQMTIGNYNMEDKLLTLEFNSLPSIYLTVPNKELNDFDDAKALKLQNSKFGLNAKDEFELIYTEVLNTKNGKKYVFNNMQRESLAFLENEENFVPLELIQASNMEEMRLEEIKQNVLKQAMEQNILSEHTHISVKTDVKNNVNAEGKKILDYEVGFSYTVDEGMSEAEDYGAGKYKVDESHAATAMLTIMLQALRNEFSKYIVPGKRLTIEVIGSADATPIVNTLKYDGCYGDYDKEPVYQEDQLTSVSVSAKTGFNTNEQLAFLRAIGVKDYILKNVPDLSNMILEHVSKTYVSKETGSEHRRIGLKFTFTDAFE